MLQPILQDNAVHIPTLHDSHESTMLFSIIIAEYIFSCACQIKEYKDLVESNRSCPNSN